MSGEHMGRVSRYKEGKDLLKEKTKDWLPYCLGS
mgnify:FL=1